MKLIKRMGESWQYALNQNEVALFDGLLKKFPFTNNVPVKISKSGRDPEAFEREQLLNESLAEHRKELKRQAMNLVAAEKFKQSAEGYWVTFKTEEREILLQILNDIRVGCWRALGEPETMELEKPDYTAQELKYHGLMNLAGYFEHHLIGIN
jgi:hypothetical protein